MIGVRRRPWLAMGLLIFLAFVWQTAFMADASLGMGVRFDLLAVLVAVSAYRWEVPGGLLAGAWSGLLASSLHPTVPLRVIFLYTCFGYVAALLMDGAARDRVGRRVLLALTMSMTYFLFEAALFASRGLTVVPALSPPTIAANAALLLCLLECATWLPLDGSRRGPDLVRGIVT